MYVRLDMYVCMYVCLEEELRHIYHSYDDTIMDVTHSLGTVMHAL